MPVAVISETLARQISPSGNPVGDRSRFPGMDPDGDVWMVIVGVVSEVKHNGSAAPSWPDIYGPYTQRAFRTKDMTLVVKTADDSGNSIAAIRSEIQSIDKKLPISFELMTGILSKSLAPQLNLTALLGLFALCAIFLSITGFYIVMKSALNLRQGEERLPPLKRDSMDYSIKTGIGLAGKGIVAGCGVVILISYAIPEVVYGLRVNELVALAVTSVIIFLLTLATSYVIGCGRPPATEQRF